MKGISRYVVYQAYGILEQGRGRVEHENGRGDRENQSQQFNRFTTICGARQDRWCIDVGSSVSPKAGLNDG
jgi:outer membrane phospholipase A